MNVPFLDVGAATAELRGELDAAYQRVAAAGRYVLGPEVEAFEREFAAYCGAEHCLGVGSGLDALHLILRGYGVGPGDEVVVPAHTYVATWLAVSYAGATPVPVEPDPVSLNLDPREVDAAITQRTRAVIAVHLYGRPADMAALHDVARRHEVKLIEDAAQAHGARHRGRRAGSLADAAAFSFYPVKNLGALGDGGAVVTDDAELAERVGLLRNYGSRVKYEHELRGFNSRLDTLQAAFLRAKLPHLERWNDRRRAVAERYSAGLAGLPELVLPPIPGDGESVWHLYVVRHPRRDQLQATLRQAGIETLIHYPVPPHLSGAYRSSVTGELPRTERLARTVLSLPIGPHLSEPEQAAVVAAVRRAVTGSRVVIG